MDKQCHNLRDSVIGEEERCDVGERHDGKRVEQQQSPYSIVLQVKDHGQEQDDADGEICLDDVRHQIGDPISWQTDT